MTSVFLIRYESFSGPNQVKKSWRLDIYKQTIDVLLSKGTLAI